jgi:hypothetical protein
MYLWDTDDMGPNLTNVVLYRCLDNASLLPHEKSSKSPLWHTKKKSLPYEIVSVLSLRGEFLKSVVQQDERQQELWSFNL